MSVSLRTPYFIKSADI